MMIRDIIKIGVLTSVTLAIPAVAQADSVLFGTVSAHYDAISVNGLKKYRFNDRSTRIGVKGADYISDALEANYFLEIETAIADESKVVGEVRQAWLGVRGDFGEVRVGRHLSPARVSVAPVDPFEGQQADHRRILESEVVHHRSVAYINRFAGIGYAIAFSSNDQNNRISTDVLANYNTERWYAAAAYLKGGDHRDTARLAVGYRFPEGHRLGAAYEHLDDTRGHAGHDAYLFSAAYKVKNSLFKVQWGRNDPEAAGQAETLVGVGVDYQLSENTLLQFEYSLNQHRDHTADDRERAVSLGISHRF